MKTSDSLEPPNHRILVIDDNPAIHEDFRKILCPADTSLAEALDDDEAALFGDTPEPARTSDFHIDSAFQGQEGLEKVRAAVAAGAPYAVAFVDVRMPPGWDGIETITRIWAEFPDLQIVICTAYSDYSWNEIAKAVGDTDHVLVLKKPFDNIEVMQMAHALSKKWQLTQIARKRVEELDAMVALRTSELRAANELLKSEVAERTVAQEALRGSEERFSKAFESSPVPMAIQSAVADGFVAANAGFLKLTGYAGAELLGLDARTPVVWFEEATGGLVRELLAQDSPPRDLPVAVRSKNGERRETLLSVEPIALGGEPHLLLIVQDITDRVRVEEQLRQAQKMEAVGRLAAGIAHDFNNLLTVILGNASMELGNPGIEQGIAKSLQQVVAAGERATELTRQLLAYSRRQIIQRRALDLNEATMQTVGMLRRIIGEHIAIVTEMGADLKPIYADPVNVDQVLMNLALNARDAMKDGGRLLLGSGLRAFDADALVNRPDAPPGEYVFISVRDTGCGMNAETLSRVFEPFFTTKDMGHGTGMGLATVYGIVKQHGGWIDVESEPGHGTCFRVFFPIAEGKAAPTEERQELALRVAPGVRGTILVVEDEEMLREFVGSVLESCGHRVLFAANGVEALDVWAREKDGIDVLLTDVVMPESMSGWQLAHRLRAERPGLKVVYTSGYSPELIGGDFEQETNRVFLAKPYHSDRLAQIVSECMAG